MDSNSVVEIFREITKIPRESGHEEKMTQFLVDFAKSHSLRYKVDKIGNVVIFKPASAGKESVPAMVFQSHQDMVCEKLPHSNHNFDTDPIQYVVEDGWMVAKETTLGADDGIGVAASLALLECDLPMGPIECLFTISEETGMDGAFGMEEGFFEAKTLVNLDSEDEGQLFVGCAGGLDTTITFDYKREAVKAGSEILKLRIFDGQGGHSGDDINKNRANAVQQMARFLYGLEGRGCQLISFQGGNKYNAIPRDAEALIAVPAAEVEKVSAEVKAFGEVLAHEFNASDPQVKTSVEKMDASCQAVESAVAHNVIASMVAVHNGVMAMSQDIGGLVETSTHLAFIKMQEEGVITIGTSQRSSVDSAKIAVADKVKACFELAGGKVVRSGLYPGWKPNMDSHILEETVASYRRQFGVDPEVKAIHAGLECGLFLEKFPYLDMISFGPTLRGVHAPGERLNLESNEKFVKLLVDLVTNFK